MLTAKALELHEKAGIAQGPVCVNNYQTLQNVLTEHQLIVFEGRDVNLIYKGPSRDKKIFILLADNHYYFIKSMTAFLCRSYFCHDCLKGYSNKHTCINKCRYCGSTPKCKLINWQNCDKCNRVFRSVDCLNNHQCLESTRCPICYQLTSNDHMCGSFVCPHCSNKVHENHECFMTKPKDKKKLKGSLIFFDIESRQEREIASNQFIHEPNLVVSRKICTKCVNAFTSEPCHLCEERYFENERSFCDYVFSPENKNSVCVSHYGRAYDSVFVTRYLLDENVKPSVISSGTKLLYIEVKSVKFIDSFSFLPMKLSALPKAFGFKDECKGYYPHLFNTKENANYIGPIPDAKYYASDLMSADERNVFYNWYNAQKDVTFNNKSELLKYCRNDVHILTKACLTFRKLFHKITDMDPLCYVTLAQCCLDLYRNSFLIPNTIALIPDIKDKYSFKSLSWLKQIELEEGIQIKHALNGGETKIGPYKVDGINGRTVFEFYGCFFHGCPKHYRQPDARPYAEGLSYTELYERTIARRLFLEKQGYTVREMWECDFTPTVEVIEPLNIRDALFGGRVEVFTAFREPQPGETIHYIDITSLYPFVNKTCEYPVGHPIIIKSDFKDIKQYRGLVKCKIIAPQNLLIPLLPSRINGKLVFALCRTCAVELSASCNHNEDERTLIGTWCTPEIHKAVDLGYHIIEIQEIWHFRDGRTDLFTGYINTFLKIKQEASGWPTETKSYIEDYYRHEGIRLDPSKIDKNPGLRSIAKLILNCLWGKLGQRTNLPKIDFITQPLDLYKLLGDSNRQVKSIDIITDEMLKVTHTGTIDTVSDRTSTLIASFTTSYARLILYSYLEKVEDRVLYCDTDSLIYTSKFNETTIPLSEYLGGMTAEIPADKHITQFIAVGPKSYGYELNDGTSVLKLKGITLNYETGKIIDLELLNDMLRVQKEIKVPVSMYIKRLSTYDIVTTSYAKSFKLTINKRQLLPDFSTLPWGFV